MVVVVETPVQRHQETIDLQEKQTEEILKGKDMEVKEEVQEKVLQELQVLSVKEPRMSYEEEWSASIEGRKDWKTSFLQEMRQTSFEEQEALVLGSCNTWWQEEEASALASLAVDVVEVGFVVAVTAFLSTILINSKSILKKSKEIVYVKSRFLSLT